MKTIKKKRPRQKKAILKMFMNGSKAKTNTRPDLDSSNFRKNMAKTLKPRSSKY